MIYSSYYIRVTLSLTNLHEIVRQQCFCDNLRWTVARSLTTAAMGCLLAALYRHPSAAQDRWREDHTTQRRPIINHATPRDLQLLQLAMPADATGRAVVGVTYDLPYPGVVNSEETWRRAAIVCVQCEDEWDVTRPHWICATVKRVNQSARRRRSANWTLAVSCSMGRDRCIKTMPPPCVALYAIRATLFSSNAAQCPATASWMMLVLSSLLMMMMMTLLAGWCRARRLHPIQRPANADSSRSDRAGLYINIPYQSVIYSHIGPTQLNFHDCMTVWDRSVGPAYIFDRTDNQRDELYKCYVHWLRVSDWILVTSFAVQEISCGINFPIHSVFHISRLHLFSVLILWHRTSSIRGWKLVSSPENKTNKTWM